MDNRIITTDVMEEDFSLEGNLRPQTLDEYIGQEKTKNTLKGPCPLLWSSWPWKDYFVRNYCQ